MCEVRRACGARGPNGETCGRWRGHDGSGDGWHSWEMVATLREATPAAQAEEDAWEFLADWWSNAPAGGILFVKDSPEFYAHLRTHTAKIEGDETAVLVIAPHEHPLDAIRAMMREETTVPHPPRGFYDDRE